MTASDVADALAADGDDGHWWAVLYMWARIRETARNL